ncbi:MAG: class I SAM-dependent methyltransferase [Syntrophomonadaceae bacterium]
MKYDNTAHWKNLHLKYGDSLKTVGISGLSEAYNQLKYSSESESLVKILDELKSDLLSKEKLSVLDIGAGIGFWSALIHSYFQQHNKNSEINSLDISESALEIIKSKNPGFKTIAADLKTIDVNSRAECFDFVVACYCFHHLTGLLDYLNAVKFAARSVKPGGYLAIMDPILSKPFSKFYSVDYPTYSGHSLPRPLYLIDGLLLESGFRRIKLSNALSYLLAANVESNSRWGYFVQNKIWKFFYYLIYKNDGLTKALSGLVKSFDSSLKTSKYSNGTVTAVYQKL